MLDLYKRLTAAAVLAMAYPVGAQTMSGAGGKQCGDFMQAVELNSETAINGYISWAQGFVSGFNWSNVKGADVLIDHGSLSYWLIDYCGGHRDVSFYQAVQALIGHQAR